MRNRLNHSNRKEVMFVDQVLNKKYRPEYTQLPYGFLNDNSALHKIVRKEGPAALAIYIVIQDKMAKHSDEDFTLSMEELVEEIQETLFLYDEPVEDIQHWLEAFKEAGILEERKIVIRTTDVEETRYCLPLVADTLVDARQAWISKCINPMKIPKEDKSRLKEQQEKVNALRKQIRLLLAAKRRCRDQLSRELALNNGEKDVAQALLAAIDSYEWDISALYRKIHSIEHQMEKLCKGGESDDVQ